MVSAASSRASLTLVVDRGACAGSLEDAVERAVRGGVDRVQLRERQLEGAEWLDWARGLVAAVRRANRDTEIIVNRRVDIALATSADGVHLGFDAMAIADARELLGPAALIGVSTHSPDEAATQAGADYVHLAPIFAPLSKAGTRDPLGPAALTEARDAGATVIAQGGITADNVRTVLDAGASGVAVTGTILAAADSEAAARALRAAMDTA